MHFMYIYYLRKEVASLSSSLRTSSNNATKWFMTSWSRVFVMPLLLPAFGHWPVYRAFKARWKNSQRNYESFAAATLLSDLTFWLHAQTWIIPLNLIRYQKRHMQKFAIPFKVTPHQKSICWPDPKFKARTQLMTRPITSAFSGCIFMNMGMERGGYYCRSNLCNGYRYITPRLRQRVTEMRKGLGIYWEDRDTGERLGAKNRSVIRNSFSAKSSSIFYHEINHITLSEMCLKYFASQTCTQHT